MTIFRNIIFIPLLAMLVGCAVNPAAKQKLNDNDFEAVVAYLKSGNNVNKIFPTRYYGHPKTLLNKAISGRSIKTVKYLIKNGAHINTSNDKTTPPLIFAAGSFKSSVGIEIIDILMDAGADVNIRDKSNHDKTALHEAVNGSRYSIIKHLVMKYKADMNLQDKLGGTPVHDAGNFLPHKITDYGSNEYMLKRNKEMIFEAGKILTIFKKYGADFSIKDMNGDTPIDLYRDSLTKTNIEIKKFNADAANSFQWGKFAALSVGASLGGASNLSSSQQASLITSMAKDSATGINGVSNTKSFVAKETAKINSINNNESLPKNNRNKKLVAKNSCSINSGSYLEGGRWKTHYTLNSDCTGTYCVQVLNNPKIPTSGYGWYCNEGRGKKKITGWKKSNGNYLINLANGQSISRPVTHLKKQ